MLDRVEPNGYFVGGFFGKQHVWANNPELNIFTVEKLEAFMTSPGFSFINIKEEFEDAPIKTNDRAKFHTIELIAQKILK